MKKIFLLLIFILLFISCNNNVNETILEEEFKLPYKMYNVVIDNEKLEGVAFNLGNKIYIKADELFKRLDYDILENENSVYKKDNEIIEFSNENVLKNNLVLNNYNDYLYIDNNLYVNDKLLENLVSIDVRLEDNNVYIDKKVNWTKHRLIAHAMGNIGGKLATNSLEAFLYSYQNGYRLFECDLILTLDNNLIARHDWSRERYMDFLQGDMEGSLNLLEAKSKLIYGKYQALDFKDIAIIMSKYKDVYLITDTKELDISTIKTQFTLIVETSKKIDESILERIIPQFYSPSMYEAINEIYNFNSYIFTLYLTSMKDEEVRKFAVENNIKIITMPDYSATPEYVNMLKEEGIYIYVHTLNNMIDMKKYLDMGVHGFYTDFMLPSYFNIFAGSK